MADLPHMRILIAGGSGFVASHMADRFLSQGHTVVAVDNFATGSRENTAHLLDHPRFTLVEADVVEPLTDEQLGLKAGETFDRVYHMASPASPIGYVKQQVLTLKTNSAGTWNLLELCERHGARFLMASTSECYGDPAVNPQPESYWGNVNPIGMRSMYDEAKRFSEACTMAYARERGVETRIVRIFNTYGPRMDPHDGRVVISFIRQALNNEPLTVFGDGSQTRSLCYVSDLIRGINLLMESDEIEPVNIGNPSELTILDIAKEVLALIPESESEIKHYPMPPDDPKVRCPDISKAKRVLGWEPTVSRSEGLAKMIEFYRESLTEPAAEENELAAAVA